MLTSTDLPPLALDVPTLAFVAVCLSGLLGLFLIFVWLQQRDARALAWWGSAYLIGASAMALWGAPSPLFRLPPEIPEAMTFLACGVIWNGVRVFHERRATVVGAFIGPVGWLAISQLPGLSPGSYWRIAAAAAVVAAYTFCIAFELWRERRTSLHSRTSAIIVPSLHATVFLMPILMQAVLPKVYADLWITVFTLETMIYAVGTAFIVLLMVKDRDLQIIRDAASTDSLTGLLNRRAFLDRANSLCARQGQRGGAVTVLMFDLDHFKSINDRFGHAVGDDVLRVFAQAARSSMRTNDIIGRLGGEEFAAIIPNDLDIGVKVGERMRAAFQVAGTNVGEHAIGATVSIGAAAARAPVMEVGPLLVRADAALYRAKNDGRNRLFAAQDEAASAGTDDRGSRPASAERPLRQQKATKEPASLVELVRP